MLSLLVSFPLCHCFLSFKSSTSSSMARKGPFMETQHLHFLCLLLLSLLPPLFSASFVPLDNYLLNCGSAANSSFFNRIFIGDSTKLGSVFLYSDQSVSVKDPNPPPNSPSLYNTARVFTSSSSYRFGIKKNGTHLVRFHFSPFVVRDFDLASANVSILVNGFLLLSDFNPRNTTIKEYILTVDDNFVKIVFEPLGDSGFGFVNAIEVFSAPVELINDNGARLVGEIGVGEYFNLSSKILETVLRINVGGYDITPFNDTLWRTWVPDDNFLVLKSAAKRAVTTRPPNYKDPLLSREIAPDNVYMTAQQMNKENATLGAKFNITWNFSVGRRGGMHLVRLHFCDIVSSALNLLYFNVYINGYSAYADMDLSSLSFRQLASPLYIDFIVDSDDNGVIRVSVGPSALSSPSRLNAILSGAEIMRMVNVNDSGRQGRRKEKDKWILVGSIVGGFIGLCGIIIIIFLSIKCRKEKKPKPRRAESGGWTSLHAFGGSSISRMTEGRTLGSPGPNGYYSLKIPFNDVKLATKDFDRSLIIGSGGFGMVYKGVFRDNTKVAVKRALPGSRQGLPEFQTEITVLSKIRHHHLVSLVGYCEEQSEMILVYEYMEKGPLKTHLYGSRFPPLSWKQRLEICIGSARGLHYLHTGFAQGIIHRDIKSTNILLDDNYVPKVADFGLSRSGPCLDETHVSTGVKGSFGYLDPEYFRRQQLTDKSDVYSFGVVLLEVLCARPAVDPLLAREQVNLAEWAMEWQKKGMIEQIIDPKLVGKINSSSLKKFGETAEKCLSEYGVDRPSMGDVLWNLEYALQLQENGLVNEQDAIVVNPTEVQALQISPDFPASSSRGEGEDDNGRSDISTSKVFSQLMNNAGR